MTHTADCTRDHDPQESPCGQPCEKPGEPCRYCGDPVPLDGSACPKCWVPVPENLADAKALFARGGFSLGGVVIDEVEE